MSTITQDMAYSVADPCGFQVGDVACDGTPLLEADGGRTVLYSGVLQYEVNDLITPSRRDVDPQGSGLNCGSRTIDSIIDGAEFLLQNCAKVHPGLLVQWGVSNPVFSSAGALIGTKGFKASSTCRCGNGECERGGFYMYIWSRAFGCNDNEELFDDEGNPVYEVTVLPWLKKFTPTGPARRGQNMSDARRNLRGTLIVNSNFGQGPGLIYPVQPDDTDPANPIGLCEPYAQYLTCIPFPGACMCTNHGGYWDPSQEVIPVGEAGWVDPTA